MTESCSGKGPGRGSAVIRDGDPQNVAAPDGASRRPGCPDPVDGSGRIGPCVQTGGPSSVPGAVPGAPQQGHTADQGQGWHPPAARPDLVSL